MSDNEESYEAEFELDDPSPPRLENEHCKAKRSQIDDIGRSRCEQVRIEFDIENEGTTSAIYTVSVFHNGNAKLVVLGDKLKDLLPNCEISANKCNGKVKAQIMLKDIINDSQAEDRGELIEHLDHEIENHRLIVIAPHGGEIEKFTDKQAEYVWSKFSRDRASLWSCKGFSSKFHADALERWHITSTEINPESFPQLKKIIGQSPTFDYSIAFHGWKEDFICVGGNPENPDTELITETRNAIKAALEERNSNIVVNVAPCSGDFNGDSPENIVNRLGTNSVQIEQCKLARHDHHEAIAQAVVKGISNRMDNQTHSIDI